MSSDSEIITCTGAWLDVHYIYVAPNSVQLSPRWNWDNQTHLLKINVFLVVDNSLKWIISIDNMTVKQ